jgi:hypothetical protein
MEDLQSCLVKVYGSKLTKDPVDREKTMPLDRWGLILIIFIPPTQAISAAAGLLRDHENLKARIHSGKIGALSSPTG